MRDVTPRLQLVDLSEPEPPVRRPPLAGGRISGSRTSRSRHEERRRLVRELEAAKRWRRSMPLSYAAECAVERALSALNEFDGPGVA